jgi:anti-sigma B factor antagonist
VSFTTVRRGDIIAIDLEGPLVVGNRQELKHVVLEELQGGARKFLFDFARTGYLDSSGLGILVSLSKQIRERGGTLRLANLSEDLKTLFALARLDRIIDIEEGDDGTAGAGVPAPSPRPPKAPGAEERRPG